MNPGDSAMPGWTKPYWHIERCRIGEISPGAGGSDRQWRSRLAEGNRSRRFVNPQRAAGNQGVLLGRAHPPSVHTNPVVTVGDQPVRASKRSAEWCLKAVDQCWSQKSKGIRSSERAAAKQAYDEAKSIYERILSETIRN